MTQGVTNRYIYLNDVPANLNEHLSLAEKTADCCLLLIGGCWRTPRLFVAQRIPVLSTVTRRMALSEAEMRSIVRPVTDEEVSLAMHAPLQRRDVYQRLHRSGPIAWRSPVPPAP